MSPKVALALLLLCCVLLGHSNAQRQQRQQQGYRGRVGAIRQQQPIRSRQATDQPGQTAPQCIDNAAAGGADQPASGVGNPEPAPEVNRTPNNLAANIKDKRKPH